MNTETVPLNPPRLNADELRSKMVELFTQFKPTLQQYYDYAQRAAALGEEYHMRRLEELGPPVEAGTLVATLDARATPKSLDHELGKFPPGSIRRIVHDRMNARYYLFA